MRMALFSSCSCPPLRPRWLNHACRASCAIESGAVVSGASVLVIGASGVQAQTITGPDGTFSLDPGTASGATLVVRAGGFAERSQAAGAQRPAGHRAGPGRRLRIGHGDADPHRTAARRRARQRDRDGQGADSPVAGHGGRRRPAPGPDLQPVPPHQQPARRIPPRRACRCAASARAASAARWCSWTACRSTIRSAAGSIGRACRSRTWTASRWWTGRARASTATTPWAA